MTSFKNTPQLSFMLLVFLGLLVGFSPVEAHAADLKLKAQLIWGTDDAKPANKPNLTELDSKLKEKLGKVNIFRWTNYFQVSQQIFGVKPNGSKITSLSHKCVIEVKHLGQEDIEVKLYGEGKLVHTVRQPLHKGEYLILGGDDKDKYKDAWIVALSLDTPEPKPPQ
jgi:hypothetical protein